MRQVSGWVYASLAGLFLLIVGLALTAESAEAVPAAPVVPTGQAGVAEHRLSLSDGRAVTCLIFAHSGAVSCDWPARKVP